MAAHRTRGNAASASMGRRDKPWVLRDRGLGGAGFRRPAAVAGFPRVPVALGRRRATRIKSNQINNLDEGAREDAWLQHKMCIDDYFSYHQAIHDNDHR